MNTPVPSRRRWPAAVPRTVAVLSVLVLAGQIACLLHDPARFTITAVSMGLLDTLGLVYSVLALRRGGNRIIWLSSAAARTLSILSSFLLVDLAPMSVAWWWLGTTLGLVMYAAMAVAVLAVPAQRLAGRQLAAFVAEVLTVAGGGFMFVWHFVLMPVLARPDRSHLMVMTIGFPIGDLLLLVAVTALVLRGRIATAPRPVILLAGGITLYLVSDLLFDSVGSDGIHSTGPRPATLSIVLASLLLTVAAMVQVSRPEPAAAAAFNPMPPVWASYFPYAATGAGFVLMIVVTVLDDQLTSWGGLVLGMIVMTGAVVARQLLSLRDSRGQIVTDTLTGLANRVGLHRAVERAVRRGESIALLAIHLDGFKQVNELHGYAGGDLMLAEFAHQMRITTRGADVAGRVGGDEFAVLVHDIREPAEAMAAARRLLAAATRPVRIGDHQITVRASIGVATSRPGDHLEDLSNRAAVAVYQAKRAGDHDCVLYEESMTDRRGEDALLARDLEHAVADDQLLVLYQPMVDLATGRPRGVEALVRWQHPDRGLISPLDFIPVAEQNGTIIGIGLHVLEQACRQIQDWRRRLPADRPFYASVNVSPRQLRDPGLVADVLAVLARTGTAAADLVLEVTESAVVDEQIAIPSLRALRAHGIRIAIDDFGTGYSSLHYLTRLPVDILKIDRSFVAELDGTTEGAAVAQAVVHLSQALHLRTVAEGIETTDQAAELLRLGCDIGQGYLYARPLPAAEVTAMISTPAAQRA
jgi:diguanylate cyclase (GGDEF)-like protein